MIKLNQFISIFDNFNDIKILRADCHKDNIYNYNPAFYHQIYFGKILDMSEDLMDYYVVENSLSAEIDDTNYPYFTIVVVKDLPHNN